MTISQLMLPELDREMPRTRKLIANIPPKLMSWSPGHGLNTIGWNANHLANIVEWPVGIVQEDELDLAPPGQPPQQPKMEEDPLEVARTFDANLAKGRAAIATATDAQLAEPWSLKAGGQVIFTMSKGDVLRTWVFTHVAHHSAILSVYLRLAGVEMRSILEG